MAAIERFEDIIAWQKARELTKMIYRTSKGGSFAKDYDLARQIQRAAVSIMSNIAEGFERGGNREFHRFLCIAKASCAEVRSLLYVALDEAYLNQESFMSIMERAAETGRVIGGLRASVQQRDGDLG